MRFVRAGHTAGLPFCFVHRPSSGIRPSSLLKALRLSRLYWSKQSLSTELQNL